MNSDCKLAVIMCW